MIKYNNDLRLKLKVPNFKVNMGFGLNMGWAIEGAIGSAYKIDASYLSPNVNMASRLEAATKQFKTTFLISEKLQKYCSPSLQKFLRKVDVVTVKGSAEPIALFTFDLDFQALTPHAKPKPKVFGFEKKRMIYRQRIAKEKFLEELHSQQLKIEDLLQYPEIKEMRKRIPSEFYRKWKVGFEYYISGDWKSAKQVFSETLDIVENFHDGPSETLLAFMGTFDFKAPPYWKGIRKLTEK